MASSKMLDSRRKIGSRATVLLGVVGLTLSIGWYWMTPSRAELEQMAFDAIAQQDFSKAEIALKRISPRNQDVLRLLADVAFRQGRKRDCLQWLERLAELSPQSPDLICEVGEKAFEFARPLNAERLYRKAIKISPTSLVPYQRLARLYLACQRGDDLRQLIAAADAAHVELIDDPVLLWLWIVGDRVDWNEQDSRRWLESVALEQPEDYYAAAALLQNSFEATRTISDSKLAHVARTWPMIVAKASLELESNRVDESLALLDIMPKDGELHARTWFLLGQIADAVGDTSTAIQAWEYTSRLDPLFVPAHYHRGQLLAKVGRTVESESALRLAVRTDLLVQKCVRQLQSTQSSTEDLLAMATMAMELNQERWAQLVCKMIERNDQHAKLPAAISSIRNKPLPAISLPNVETPPKLTIKKSPSKEFPRIKSIDQSGPEPSGIQFTETTQELALEFVYEYGHTKERWLMETLGGGVAVLDYDRDGWPDLYFAQGGSLSEEPTPTSTHGQLKRNLRGLSLPDVTIVSHAVVTGYSHGCAVGDVNNDGFADLLVSGYGGLTLLTNQGDGTWHDFPLIRTIDQGRDSSQNPAVKQSESSAHDGTSWNTSAAFVDLDLDGNLDLYVAGYCHAPMSKTLRSCREENRYLPCRPNAYRSEPDRLMMNTGTGEFEDRTDAFGIRDESGYGLGVIAADFDQDGFPEIFVGNDTTQNFLWHRSERHGKRDAIRFSDVGLAAGVAVDGNGRAEACMGIACGDIDGDQQLDLFVTNFFDETSTLYHNLGNLQFEDRTQQFGFANNHRQFMGWGCQFLDADNDGWLDLVLVNGYLHDKPQLPQFYRNRRARFVEQSTTAGAYFQKPKLGRSVATWDYNRDGRLDCVISHQSEPGSVLRNDSSAGGFLTLTVVGTKSARDGTGVVIRARIKDRQIMRYVSSQGGYLSACTSDVIIGIGDAVILDELKIEWPGGTRDQFIAIRGGQHLIVVEGSSELLPLPTD